METANIYNVENPTLKQIADWENANGEGYEHPLPMEDGEDN